MVRVLVAEDSLTVRELLVSILESDPEIEVVGQAKNGLEAVELTSQLGPDLITMDVHMPVMDGFQATKEIMVHKPTPIIIVSSSSSGRDVTMSLNALRAGALMVLEKPDDPGAAGFNGRQDRFLRMVKAMADVKVVRRWGRSARLPGTLSPGPRLSDAVPPSVVAIAASTGGPAALQRILGDLPADFAPPLLIVQHIATGFTQGLADWLAAGSPLKIEVARHKDPLAARTALLAPDERHLAVERRGAVAVLDSPPVGGFRPSASVLFESVARTFGSSAVGVVLTGMGADGVQGLEALRASGGHVIAQDEGSSVVYGMPRAAVEAGVVDLVLPLDEIGGYLTSLVAPASATPSSPARPKRGTP